MNIVSETAAERKCSENIPISKPLLRTFANPRRGEDPSREHIYEASQKLVDAGLSIIPIDAYEGSKSPDNLRLPYPHDPITGKPKASWAPYQIRRASRDELRKWYEREGAYGLAVVGGTVSGGAYGIGLEVIDL